MLKGIDPRLNADVLYALRAMGYTALFGRSNVLSAALVFGCVALFGCGSTDHLKKQVASLETQLTKIEHQGNFNHPAKANYHPPENGEDSSMPYLEGAVVAIDNASGGIRGLVGGR